MIWEAFIDQDITVYSEFGPHFRGVLREIFTSDGLLKFEVGIDVLYVRADTLHALTVHGIS